MDTQDAASASDVGSGTVPGRPKSCGLCGRPVVGRKANAHFCSDVCKRRDTTLYGPVSQRVLDLGGSGVGAEEARGADPEKSSVVAQESPLPQSIPGVQHYSPDMGQSATRDEGRRVKDCQRVLAVLEADPSRWWAYQPLAIAAGVPIGSCRTRVSNLSLAGVDLERRVVDGFREVRLKEVSHGR